MHLISCDSCGVVLHVAKLKFPTLWNDHPENMHPDAIWTGTAWVTTVPCPACKEPVNSPMDMP